MSDEMHEGLQFRDLNMSVVKGDNVNLNFSLLFLFFFTGFSNGHVTISIITLECDMLHMHI